MRRQKNYRVICQSPADHNQTLKIPANLAWSAARGIVQWTHNAVVIEGEFGRARFRHDGTGYVEWNDKSAAAGTTTTFDERTTVSI